MFDGSSDGICAGDLGRQAAPPGHNQLCFDNCTVHVDIGPIFVAILGNDGVPGADKSCEKLAVIEIIMQVSCGSHQPFQALEKMMLAFSVEVLKLAGTSGRSL
ncbi:hypothetical protein AbraIFM66951_010627, partial [Aspergillus brasiliensis]